MQTESSKMASMKSSREQKISQYAGKPNQVGNVLLYGIPIVSLVIDSQERLCLAQISNTLLKQFSYNEIHNRRVALGITCVQCTPVQLEILRRAGAMPVSSRRCGMITRREAERLCKSFLGDNAPPRLPDDFAFSVHHECAWGCRGAFLPSRYNSSRAKCIKCSFCGLFFSPNKFIFHSHRTGPGDKYVQPDAANFNSWRRHMKLSGGPPEEITHAWEDVKAMFNGGTRKRLMTTSSSSNSDGGSTRITPPKQSKTHQETPTPIATPINFPVTSPPPILTAPPSRVPSFTDISLPLSRSLVMDYMWHQTQAAKQHQQFPFSPYTLPWLKRGSPLFFGHTPSVESPYMSFHKNPAGLHEAKPLFHQSAFRPVQANANAAPIPAIRHTDEISDDETVDIETTEDEQLALRKNDDSPRPVWSPQARQDAETLSGSETVLESRSSPQTRSPVRRHSSSPDIVKVESNTSPPLPPAYPRITEVYEEPSVPKMLEPLYKNGIDFRERPELKSFHPYRDPINLSPATPRHHRLGEDHPQPEHPNLWSVARLTMERPTEIYRPEAATLRAFIDSSDKSREQAQNGSSMECRSCPACQPLSPHQQGTLITTENNNKISTS